jgi:hypothetical protein
LAVAPSLHALSNYDGYRYLVELGQVGLDCSESSVAVVVWATARAAKSVRESDAIRNLCQNLFIPLTSRPLESTPLVAFRVPRGSEAWCREGESNPQKPKLGGF